MTTFTAQPPAHKHRPYWHQDLKWICGILLFFTLGASLLLYNISNLTTREQAVPLSAGVVAGLFSKNGLGDPSGLDSLRQQAASLAAGASVSPVPQFPTIHLTKEQIMTLSPEALRIAIFSQLTGAIYDKGLNGAAASLTNDPKQQQTFTQQASVLSIMTKERHDIIQRIAIIFGAISLLWLALLVYFSAGWGKLVSPAMVLLLVSPLGALVGLLILGLSQANGPLSNYLTSSSLDAIGANLRQSYGVATVVGLGLLVIALIGKIVQSIVNRNKNRPAFLKD